MHSATPALRRPRRLCPWQVRAVNSADMAIYHLCVRKKLSEAEMARKAARQLGRSPNAISGWLFQSSSFALRIQTSEPVLVSIAKAHGHGATSAVGMQLLRDRRDWSPTEASAAVLAPYIFGKLGLHEEPPDPFGRDSS